MLYFYRDMPIAAVLYNIFYQFQLVKRTLKESSEIRFHFRSTVWYISTQHFSLTNARVYFKWAECIDFILWSKTKRTAVLYGIESSVLWRSPAYTLSFQTWAKFACFKHCAMNAEYASIAVEISLQN